MSPADLPQDAFYFFEEVGADLSADFDNIRCGGSLKELYRSHVSPDEEDTVMALAARSYVDAIATWCRAHLIPVKP